MANPGVEGNSSHPFLKWKKYEEITFFNEFANMRAKKMSSVRKVFEFAPPPPQEKEEISGYFWLLGGKKKKSIFKIPVVPLVFGQINSK